MRRTLVVVIRTAAVLATTMGAVGCGPAGIDGKDADEARALTGGEPARGRTHIERYGCGACHTVEGVDGADGLVGPPLTGVGSRVYLGGVLMNTPANMVRWIMDPKGVDPLTAMPVLGVTEQEARDIASYLYALR